MVFSSLIFSVSQAEVSELYSVKAKIAFLNSFLEQQTMPDSLLRLAGIHCFNF